MQLMPWAFNFARFTAGKISDVRIAMMAMTTSSSIKVKPVLGPVEISPTRWFCRFVDLCRAGSPRGDPLAITEILRYLTFLGKPEPPNRSLRQGCIKLGRSADFQSAVSQVCSMQAARFFNAHRAAGRPAGYNPAIQQAANLRYEGDPGELDAAPGRPGFPKIPPLHTTAFRVKFPSSNENYA
jgi:hypothetical protein